MKIALAALLFACSALAAPTADHPEHLALRAQLLVNTDALNNIIYTDSNALVKQKDALATLQRAYNALGGLSGNAANDAKLFHQKAIDAQRRAIAATESVIDGLQSYKHSVGGSANRIRNLH
ncbi:hypothetical protein GQ54DRAFT_262710 [Martensiomyces pterosporus]|nr:hypothetical protein GQ54DRAFT_262710 [Martensiomyces pterosporus]